MNNNATFQKTGYRYKLQVQATLILLVSACLLPFLVHLVPPYNGIPMGAFFLPMFYVPFIALVFYRVHVGLIIAVLAPIINFMVAGSPNWQLITVLSFELIVFTLFAFILLQTKLSMFSAPLAYLMAKTVSSSFLFFVPVLPVSPIDFFTNSITNAAPGIIVLFILNWFLIKKRNQ